MRKMILAAAMLSMTSTAAVAAPRAAALSLQNSPTYSTQAAAAPVERERRQAIMPILIGLGVIAGVTYLIIDHENDNDRPDSN